MTFIWKVNTLFNKRRNEYARMPGDWLPERVFALLKESTDKARLLRVRQHTADLFEVQRLNDPRAFRVVDLADRTCTAASRENMAFRVAICARRFSQRTAI